MLKPLELMLPSDSAYIVSCYWSDEERARWEIFKASGGVEKHQQSQSAETAANKREGPTGEPTVMNRMSKAEAKKEDTLKATPTSINQRSDIGIAQPNQNNTKTSDPDSEEVVYQLNPNLGFELAEQMARGIRRPEGQMFTPIPPEERTPLKPQDHGVRLYNDDEKAYLKKNWKNELQFLQEQGLSIYNEEHRAQGREILRGLRKKEIRLCWVKLRIICLVMRRRMKVGSLVKCHEDEIADIDIC